MMVICDDHKLTFHYGRLTLCSHLEARVQLEKVDQTWQLLLEKAARANVMSFLADRKVPRVVAMSWARCNNIADNSWYNEILHFAIVA
jgi:hypothetical protein